jgi:hypothetical protein
VQRASARQPQCPARPAERSEESDGARLVAGVDSSTQSCTVVVRDADAMNDRLAPRTGRQGRRPWEARSAAAIAAAARRSATSGDRVEAQIVVAYEAGAVSGARCERHP